MSNNILTKKFSYMDHIYLQKYFERDTNFYKNYEKTFYYYVEKYINKDDYYKNILLGDITNTHIPFELDYEEYLKVEWVPNDHGEVAWEASSDNILQQTLDNYLDDNLKVDKDFLDSINEYDYRGETIEYYLLPIIMFILRNKIKEIEEEVGQ